MEEAVIIAAVRSPMGRANKGLLANARIDDVGAAVVQEALRRVPEVKPEEIEDLIFGCAMPEGEQGMNIARNIGLLAGLPFETAAFTLNRFCASGLQAINDATLNIMVGNGTVYIAGGVESMSHVPMGGFNPSLNEKLLRPDAPEAYIGMGMTAENVANKYGISREDQDKFALASHQKATTATEKGLFKEEMLPVEITTPDGKKVLLDKDENIRPETTLEKLASLKPAFKEGGSVTAGNSSPLTDGAAAIVITSASFAKERGIQPLAKIRAMAVAGVDPKYMGIGPVPAVQKALQRAGMQISDIDIVELNEAFAAQSLATIRELGINQENLNPHGGAIALGHPLGCTGARIMATLINDLKQANKTVGLETMCIGGGQGAATIIERLS